MLLKVDIEFQMRLVTDNLDAHHFLYSQQLFCFDSDSSENWVLEWDRQQQNITHGSSYDHGRK